MYNGHNFKKIYLVNGFKLSKNLKKIQSYYFPDKCCFHNLMIYLQNVFTLKFQGALLGFHNIYCTHIFLALTCPPYKGQQQSFLLWQHCHHSYSFIVQPNKLLHSANTFFWSPSMRSCSKYKFLWYDNAIWRLEQRIFFTVDTTNKT